MASQPLPEAHVIAATNDNKLDEVHAGWHFDTSMQLVIHTFKYRRRPSLSNILGEMLAQRLQHQRSDKTSAAVLVPVPLHPRRGRERGFNQSILLAQTLAKTWNMPLLPRGLERIRFTQQQAKLDAQARKENVEGAFAPSRNTRFDGRSVFLIDDVFTTGATMNACAAALKSAGAGRVIGLVLARAR
jgi:ComF family protein